MTLSASLRAGLIVADSTAAAARIPPYVGTAVASLHGDPARDARRHPAEIAAFAEVKPGQTVVDLIPGGVGYFSRVFSRIVGTKGKVYGVWPNEYDIQELPMLRAVAADFPNVVVLTSRGPGSPRPSRWIWCSPRRTTTTIRTSSWAASTRWCSTARSTRR